MKTEVAKQKLAKEAKKGTLVFNLVSAIIDGKVKIARPVYSSGGSWRYSSLTDISKQTEIVLSKIGIKFESGNDAPRGGKTGYFIAIKTKFI